MSLATDMFDKAQHFGLLLEHGVDALPVPPQRIHSGLLNGELAPVADVPPVLDNPEATAAKWAGKVTRAVARGL